MAFRWWADDGPIIVVFAWIVSPLWIFFFQSLTPSDKTFRILACRFWSNMVILVIFLLLKIIHRE